MGSSDSETESECFESAEESLDEAEEKKCEKPKLKISSQKSEKEEAKAVVSDNHAEDSAKGGDSSNSSLSYRKRPERVKRLNSRTQTKPTPKTPSNEVIFKTDKIVPDVFLQDITSNLSKNINKSFSTLQQKSSNVKDLILNSLPLSSVSDYGGFSYDDKSVCFEDEDKALEPEANQQNYQPEKFEENIKTEKELPVEEISKSESESLIVQVIDENKALVPEANQQNYQPEKFEENIKTEKELSVEEISKSESESLIVQVIDEDKALVPEANQQNNQSLVQLEKIEENIKTEKELPVKEISKSESELLIVKESDFYNESKAEEIDEESHVETTTDDDCKKENLNLDKEKCSSLDLDLPKIADENNCVEPEFDEPNKKEVVQDFNNEKLEYSEISAEEEEGRNKLESVNVEEETNQEIETCENLCVEPEINEEVKEENENVEPDKFLDRMENDESAGLVCSDEINNVTEENKIDTECNLEELKTALKNIVNEPVTENDNQEVNNSSADGWDDFDFSDDEVENLNKCVSSKSKELGDTKRNEEVKKGKSPVLDVKYSNDRTEVEAKKFENVVKSEKNLKETSRVANLSEKPNISNVKPEEIKTETENDSWDWDNWDDEEDKKPEIKNDKSNQDLSKWSGWDTFGQKPQEKQDNWGLGSWGVDALLNKATAVTQGISSVLEAGLGAPDPETLARMEKLERERMPMDKVIDENANPGEISKKNSLTNVNIFPVSGITSLVAGVTSKIVEHSKIQEIGTKVITGGLETLETFGKKTMEVLQEGDPGLKNKRALLLGNNKPVLSQVLKEAREKADRETRKAEEKDLAKKCHFETLFDDFQGMVHLEALEMLSRQCELKLEQIRSGMNSEEQEDLDGILEEVEQLCSLDEYDIDMKSSMLEFKTLLQMVVEPLKNEISVQNIIQIQEDASKWLQMSSETEPSFTVINQKLVSTLAELTAATVHQFHKSGELLSVKECRKTVEEVDALSRLTNALCSEINKLGEKFIKLSSNRISKDSSGDNVNSINEKVNNVMENSVFYIKQAFNLLIPILQLGAAV